MTTIERIKLPEPDTHCFDDDTNSDVWSYSPELVREIVLAHIDNLEAENERLRKDAERLDCLEALHASKMKTDAHFGGSMSAVFYQRTGIGSNIYATGYGSTVREAIDAIDAAMKGTP